jgi:hypothetical protein
MLIRIARSYSSEIGTELHNIARKRIQHGFKFKKGELNSVIVDLLEAGIPRMAIEPLDLPYIYENLMRYVNDCIGFRMTPEVVLAYSENCFGTTDAISFNEKEGVLRIFDLKTGTTPAHIEQLLIYSALFCLEYKKKPRDIYTELRIYQSNEIIPMEPTPADIVPIMDKIVSFDKIIRQKGD